MTSDSCGCPTNEAGDICCHKCGERVNVRCWKCRTPRGEGPCPNPKIRANEELIWTGRWSDALAFMDRVGYAVPFLRRPALIMHTCSCTGVFAPTLHVENTFTEVTVHCEVGDKIVWYPKTQSFGVVRTP